MVTPWLVRVVAPHFVAGLEVDPKTSRVVRAAPILQWTVGKHSIEVSADFYRKGWKATIRQIV